MQPVAEVGRRGRGAGGGPVCGLSRQVPRAERGSIHSRAGASREHIKVWREYFAQAREHFPVPELIGDPELEPSRCILETEIGTTEIGLDTQLKEIEQGFLDLLAQRPGAR